MDFRTSAQNRPGKIFRQIFQDGTLMNFPARQGQNGILYFPGLRLKEEQRIRGLYFIRHFTVVSKEWLTLLKTDIISAYGAIRWNLQMILPFIPTTGCGILT